MATEAVLEQFQNFANNRRAAVIISAVCGLVFIYSIYSIVMGWIPQSVAVQAPDIQVKRSNVTIDQIPSDHIFGASPSSLSRTNLNLTLQGVWTGSTSLQPSAIIAQPGKKGKVYIVGQDIESGVTLYEVRSRSVIIKNRGKLEELPLVRKQLQFAPQKPSIFN